MGAVAPLMDPFFAAFIAPCRPSGASSGMLELELVQSVSALTLFGALDSDVANSLVANMKQWCLDKIELRIPFSDFGVGPVDANVVDMCYTILQKLVDRCCSSANTAYKVEEG